MTSKAFEQFQLPNGTVLKNRIGKAAMEEKLADVAKHNQPSPSMIRLYKVWGEGGAGLLLSGNVMVDPTAMTGPGDVVLAKDAGQFNEAVWREWIDTAQADGSQFWLQLSHPGRQVMKGSGLPTYSPSAVPMKMGTLSVMFAVPREMSEDHIQDIIQRFVWSAQKAEQLGASGVEIHGAHGYLVSQFLSPLTNQRKDKWGGSLENRTRFLFEIIRAIRAAVSPKFGVGVKINTADFQRGGFAPEEFMKVVEWLNETGLDLLEVSGGSYESPVMSTGDTGKVSSRTAQREAYFLEAAQSVAAIAKIPIMVTGGIRRKAVLDDVVKSSDRFIAGIGSAMGYIPDLPNRWLKGEDPVPMPAKSWLLSGRLYSLAKLASVEYNIHAVAKASQEWIGVWPTIAVLVSMVSDMPRMGAYKKWISKQQDLVERTKKAS